MYPGSMKDLLKNPDLVPRFQEDTRGECFAPFSSSQEERPKVLSGPGVPRIWCDAFPSGGLEAFFRGSSVIHNGDPFDP